MQEDDEPQHTYSRVTYGQLETLFYCITRNREVAFGDNRTTQAREHSRRTWQEISTVLNAHGDGAVKNWKGWCKYWVDYKSKIKKIAAARASQQYKPASEIEEKFLAFLRDFESGLPVAKKEPVEETPVEEFVVLVPLGEDERATVDVSQATQEAKENCQSQYQSQRHRVTYGQLEELYECLCQNREVALGYNKTTEARHNSQRTWAEIATILNAHGEGAVKNWKGWCKYWVDYKSKLKKIAATRASQQRTEEEHGEPRPLTEIEEKFITLLTSIDALPSAKGESVEQAPEGVSEVSEPGASSSSETLMDSERSAVSGKSSPEKDVCRTCLGTEKLLSIFGNFGEEKMSQNLKLITGLEIKKNDGLSQKVCTKCLGTFNLLLRFRHKCKEAEKTLMNRRFTKRPKENKDYPKITKTNESVCKFVKLEYIPNVKVKLEIEDAQNVNSMKTDPHIEVEVCKKQETLTPVPSPGVCGEADDQSEDDFEWKEDYEPAEKKPVVKKMQKPEAKNVIKQEQHTIQRRRRQRIPIPRGPPYRCRKCGEALDTRDLFIRHYKKHSCQVCETCGKSCPSKLTLLMHMRAKHGLEKIHSCAQCNKTFAYKAALTRHERVHTGEKPYICEHCGRGFHHRDNLIQHLPLHLNQRNFQCSLCPFREKSKKRLQIHISQTHRVRRYSHKCPRCLKLFQRKQHAHRHLTRVHRVPRAEHPPIERVPIDHGDRREPPQEPYTQPREQGYCHVPQYNL